MKRIFPLAISAGKYANLRICIKILLTPLFTADLREFAKVFTSQAIMYIFPTAWNLSHKIYHI